MKKLSLLDDLFLWLERRHQPMHVAGLLIFSYPKGSPADYVTRLAEQMRQCSEPTYPFDQRLVERWRGNVWEHDPVFDINHHFRHVALPRPGGIKELLTFVSIEHSNLLDRSRPLWESYLIEAMNGRHFAIYTKVHHSLLDGISGMRATMRMLGDDPNRLDMPPIWQMPPSKRMLRDQPTEGLLSTLRLAGSVVGSQLSTVRPVVSALYDTIKAARENPEYANVFKAPPCRLNQPITGSRRFAAQSFERSRLKAIAEKTGSTTNDIILAICGSALRHYLLSYDCLPEQPLVAMVPVSLRKDDSIGGNQVGVILANLATHVKGSLNRLEVIKQSVEEAKEKFHRMNKDEAINYTALTLAPSGITLLTGLLPKWLAFNVVISNVPGPDKTQYWNGARLERFYPVSAIVNHMALNITIISYEGRLEFGIVGCRRTLPSMQRLLQYLDDALIELETDLGLHKPVKRNKKGKQQPVE
ncbi:MAG: wax ester/triacylglycerol synthase family O-acyltransferase [Pseudomonadales bacterium]|nr:wax ester/triacylglycerol synthase family O-acyltransferase [Pseudomonadales bacterium]